MILNVLIAIAVVAGGLSYKAAKDAQKAAKKAADAMGGVLINKESNIEPIPVIYGERRVGGVRVFVHTEGAGSIEFNGLNVDIKKNDILFVCLVLCEGEVESITDIELDDDAISLSKYSGLVEYEVFTGTDGQAASSILSRSSKWGANHKLSGVAYIAMMLKWDQDVFSGLPEITALVKGKKVYDPRNATTAWSDNPALCLRDYLTNDRYGKGLPANAINDNKFAVAANDLDSFTVTPYSGGPTNHKIFRCNAVLDTGEELFRNVERLLLGCRGFLPYSNGRYGLVIDQSTSAVMTLNTSKIIGGISISGEEKKDKFNKVIVTFPNPNTDWQPDQAIWPDAGSTEESSFQSADGGAELVEEIDLDTVTDYYAARDFARISCLRSRNALRCALTATSEAMNLVIGDVVNVTHPTPGWSSKPFQVEQISLKYDGTVDLNLIEYDSTLYAYDPASEEATYPDTDLPDPSTVAAPTILSMVAGAEIFSDGSVNSYVSIAWTAANDGFVSRYDVLVYADQVSPEEEFYLSVESTAARINGLIPGVTYNVTVRSVNTIGNVSGALSGSFTAVGDTVAPSAPTNVSAVGNFKSVDISWQNPSDADLSYVEVKESTTSSEAGAISIGKSAGTTFRVSFPNGEFTRYYWVRAVDTSGNTSSWVAASDNPAVTILLGANDFDDGIIDFNFFNTSTQTIINDIEQDIVDLNALVSSIPAYNNATTYSAGDFVTYNGNLYEAIASTTGNLPTNTTYWKLLGTYTNLGDAVGQNMSDIVEINTVSATSSSASATTLFSLKSVVEDSQTGLSATSNALSALTSRVTTAEGTVSSHTSDITALESTVYEPNNGVAANATAINNLETTVNDGQTGVSATATNVANLTTTVNGQTTSISNLQTSVNGVEAQYSVVIDNNGHVSGYGLISSNIGQGGTPTSQFVINADSFAIGSPSSTDYPFVVHSTQYTDPTTGVNIPAGTYIKSAYIDFLSASEIKTGELHLGNQDGMAVRQGKASYSSTSSGFWLGNDSGTAKFNIGDTNNKLTWDGTDLIATGIIIKAEDGTTLVEAGGTLPGVQIPRGNNLVFNGDFDLGSAGFVSSGSITFPTFDEANGSATCGSTGGISRAVQDGYIQTTEGETLYLYSLASGANGVMAVEWYNSSKQYLTFNAFSSSGTNQGNTDTDQAWSSTKKLRSVELTAPTNAAYVLVTFGTASPNSGSATFYEIGLSRVAPVINPSYAPTYIRDASIDTATIRNGAVTNKFAAYTDAGVTIGTSYIKVQELTSIDCNGGSVTVLFNCQVSDAFSNLIDVRLDGTSQKTFLIGSEIFWNGVSGYLSFPNMATIALTVTPSVGSHSISIWSKRNDTSASSTDHTVSKRFLQTVENKR